MGNVRFYVATSIDGFIADRDGAVDWLQPFDARNYGYDAFSAQVGAVVMGRRTFEYICAMGEWPYGGKRAYVLSSRKMAGLPETVVPVSLGLAAALRFARETTLKDVWIVGGAVTMQSALDAGVVDLIDVFVVPVLLGGGLSLMSELKERHTLACEGAEPFPDGVVRLRYRPHRSTATI